MTKNGPTVAKFIGDFVKKEVDNFLHKNQEVVDVLLKKIQMSERERKEISGVTTKLARERAKKVSLHNRKLRDCRFHFNDSRGKDEQKNVLMEQSSIFITEETRLVGRSRNVATSILRRYLVCEANH